MNKLFETFEYYLFTCLLLVLVLGPWMTTIFQYFNFGYFENNDLPAMVLDLFSRIPETFKTTLWFLLVPLIVILFTHFFESTSNKVYYLALKLGQLLSIMFIPLLFYRQQRMYNPVADVFVVDFFMMVFWHAYLIIQKYLKPSSFLGGPLYGMCTFLLDDSEKYQNLFAAVLLLYLTIPSLYRAYKDLGTDVLTNMVPGNEWDGYEMYSIFTVFYGSLILCFSIKAKTFLEYLEVVFFVILINANVAAAWAGVVGMKRNMTKPKKINM